VKKKTEGRQLALEGTEEDEILSRLSERVDRAVSLIDELRRERDELRRKLTEAEDKLRDHEQEMGRATEIQDDYERFKEERSEIRSRIERILGALESLEPAPEE
jgi:FtsZ-binding cell division protein ZapB